MTPKSWFIKEEKLVNYTSSQPKNTKNKKPTTVKRIKRQATNKGKKLITYLTKNLYSKNIMKASDSTVRKQTNLIFSQHTWTRTSPKRAYGWWLEAGCLCAPKILLFKF